MVTEASSQMAFGLFLSVEPGVVGLLQLCLIIIWATGRRLGEFSPWLLSPGDRWRILPAIVGVLFTAAVLYLPVADECIYMNERQALRHAYTDDLIIWR